MMPTLERYIAPAQAPRISTSQIHAVAMRRFNALMARAAQHQHTAASRPGDARNLTLGSAIDTIADEGATMAATYVDLCDIAGDVARSSAITAAWTEAAKTLNGQSLECRTAALTPWAGHGKATQAHAAQSKVAS